MSRKIQADNKAYICLLEEKLKPAFVSLKKNLNIYLNSCQTELFINISTKYTLIYIKKEE